MKYIVVAHRLERQVVCPTIPLFDHLLPIFCQKTKMLWGWTDPWGWQVGCSVGRRCVTCSTSGRRGTAGRGRTSRRTAAPPPLPSRWSLHRWKSSPRRHRRDSFGRWVGPPLEKERRRLGRTQAWQASRHRHSRCHSRGLGEREGHGAGVH